MNNYKALKLLEAFAECTKHSQRMLSAHQKSSNIFPLDVNKYRILTDLSNLRYCPAKMSG